jgi:hypothetical protein
MNAGGAKEIGALQPIEAKQLGGHVAGTMGVKTGNQAKAARRGGERSREIAAEYRRTHNT